MWWLNIIIGVDLIILFVALAIFIDEYKKGFRVKPFSKWLLKR